MSRKITKTYYFSVEGETEKWYLEWLEEYINSLEQSQCKVKFDSKIEKNPYRRAKKISITGKIDIWHLSDYESNDDFHREQFIKTMDNLKLATSLGKSIDYKFGYSNFTFDLWIILHKMDCYGEKTHRKNYISDINRAYGKKFIDMDDYKHEHNFKSCLEQLDLEDVKKAIKRAKTIMKINKDNGYKEQQYKGYSYYRENPSLKIHEVIEKILKDCSLI